MGFSNIDDSGAAEAFALFEEATRPIAEILRRKLAGTPGDLGEDTRSVAITLYLMLDAQPDERHIADYLLSRRPAADRESLREVAKELRWWHARERRDE